MTLVSTTSLSSLGASRTGVSVFGVSRSEPKNMGSVGGPVSVALVLNLAPGDSNVGVGSSFAGGVGAESSSDTRSGTLDGDESNRLAFGWVEI